MLRLKIFGRFRLEDGLGNEIAIKSKKSRALLAVLARPPGKARSREELMALLWSDRGDEQARGSLRQALSGLRRDLGGDFEKTFEIADDAIALNTSACLLIAPEPGETLLEGLSINDPAFDDWLRDERLRHEDEPREERIASSGERRKTISLAVLPFVNMSDNPEQDYFADGLTEDLISAMGRFHSVEVVARNSAFHYKSTFPLAREVGRELGVEYLVEGSVRRAGERIRISAQLIQTAESKQLWSERYDRELEDVFAVQDEVVAAISGELGVSLVSAAEQRTRSLPPEDLNAYDLLLRARAAWWRGNVKEGFKQAEEAAAIDPSYAAALAWLALQYAYQTYSATIGLPPEDIGPKSRALAKRALALDDRDPFVHMAASMCFGFTAGGNKERGLRHIETAADMNPNDSEIMLLRAWHLAFFGRTDESLEIIEKVRQLNPLSAFMVNECLTDIYYMQGEYERCLATFEDWSDAPTQSLVVYAACNAQLGKDEEARRCLEFVTEQGAESFDAERFAQMQIGICARERDAEHWREGFQKAGLKI